MRIEPISAVPSDEPRFWNTPWSPPTSLVSFSVTLDMLTFPSCEASSPRAAPARNIPVAKNTLRRSLVAEPSRMTALTTSDTCPMRTIMRGESTRESRVPTMENSTRAIESGKIRTPVSSASRPRVICR